MIRMSTCSFCRGSGTAEVMYIKNPETGDWEIFTRSIHGKEDQYQQEWRDCQCPKCAGAGEYELEYTPCKIF